MRRNMLKEPDKYGNLVVHDTARNGIVAEEVGFEPTVRFHARRFSRPVHSTTLPLLRSERVAWALAL